MRRKATALEDGYTAEFDKVDRREWNEILEKLKKSLHHGKDPDLLASCTFMPEQLKREWVELIYMDVEQLGFEHLDQVISILADPRLNLPFQEKSRKSLIHLRALFEIMDQLEKSTNAVLKQLLNGRRNDHSTLCFPSRPPEARVRGEDSIPRLINS